MSKVPLYVWLTLNMGKLTLEYPHKRPYVPCSRMPVRCSRP